jgi:hypothetical protein
MVHIPRLTIVQDPKTSWVPSIDRLLLVMNRTLNSHLGMAIKKIRQTEFLVLTMQEA